MNDEPNCPREGAAAELAAQLACLAAQAARASEIGYHCFEMALSGEHSISLRPRALLRRCLRTRWIGYASSIVGVALISLLIDAVLRHRHIANISILYLIVVLVTAVAFGRGPAILASVAAFVTFNYFFIEPVHSLTIADPGEWVALLLFLMTAAVTGQLAAGLRLRAEVAKRREREATILYDIVRLMVEPDLCNALESVTERLRNELGLAGVAISLEDSLGAMPRACVGEDEAVALMSRSALSPTLQLAGSSSIFSDDGRLKRWVRIVPPHPPSISITTETDRLQTIPVKLGVRHEGKLLVVRRSNAPRLTLTDYRLLSAAAMQVALAVERFRLQRDVTENEILRRADELKSALLNAVSHDLRTPLASIIASAASLKQHNIEFAGDEREDLARAIEEEALRLDRIVGNLLDLSRIEGGSLRPAKDWYDLSTLVDEVLGRIRPLTATHHITTLIPEDLPPLYLDYVEIDQALSNLIDNATRHTPAGTEISVAACRINGIVQVEVEDCGPGLPADGLARLFEPFFQPKRNGPRSKGTGFGLAVAKGLIEAHGGRIWAENRPGGGARFVFTLPLTNLPSGPVHE